MLVLTRFVGERIVIGDDIVVTIITIARNRVRIGIEAPRNVRIDRAEIRDTRKKGMSGENQQN